MTKRQAIGKLTIIAAMMILHIAIVITMTQWRMDIMYNNEPERGNCMHGYRLTDDESHWLMEREARRIEEQIEAVNKIVVEPFNVVALCGEEDLDAQLMLERLDTLQHQLYEKFCLTKSSVVEGTCGSHDYTQPSSMTTRNE